MIQIPCFSKFSPVCVPVLINEAVSKQHELRSIPQTASVVPPAPWEQVIKFGELLSWNGSYLPGNWKWASMMRKDCSKIFAWVRKTDGRKGGREWDGFMKCMCVCHMLAWTWLLRAHRPPGFLCSDGYWCLSSPRVRCSVISLTQHLHTLNPQRQHTAFQVCFSVTHTLPQYFTAANFCVLVVRKPRNTHTHQQWILRCYHCYTVTSIIARHNDNKVMPRGDLHYVKTDTVMLLLRCCCQQLPAAAAAAAAWDLCITLRFFIFDMFCSVGGWKSLQHTSVLLKVWAIHVFICAFVCYIQTQHVRHLYTLGTTFNAEFKLL